MSWIGKLLGKREPSATLSESHQKLQESHEAVARAEELQKRGKEIKDELRHHNKANDFDLLLTRTLGRKK